MSSNGDGTTKSQKIDEKTEVNRHSSGTSNDSVTSVDVAKAQPSTPPADAPLMLPQPLEAAIAIEELKPSKRWRKNKNKNKNTNEHKKEKVVAQEDPFGHLPDHEAAVLRKQVDTHSVKVGYWGLFKYADKKDWAIFAISLFCAVVAGVAMPLMTVVFGGLAGQFADYFNGRIAYAAFQSKLSHMVLYFIYLAVGEFITTYIYMVGFVYVGEHCAQKIRERYLQAVLRQNIGFFDDLGSGEITTRITADTNVIQDGLSEKLGLTLNALATFGSAFVIAFIRSWRLTLVLLSGLICIVLIMAVGGGTMVKWTAATHQEYAKGGTVAEEVLSSVRNATAFNTQEKLARQYHEFLKRAEKSGRKSQAMMGTMMGSMMCIVNLLYGLAFWQGSRFLVRGEIDVAKLLTVSFAVIIGSFSLGNVAPNAKAFTSAVAAGHKIFSTIRRASPMDPDAETGGKIDSLDGTIELRNIKHIYPSRPEVTVMDGVSLNVPAGKQTALVGASGSGKSTIVGLVERFYDPIGGDVFLDGINIKDLNLHWLREQISLVQQEPVLFSTTIYENIRYGLLGPRWANLSKEKEGDMIIDAAKMSNAHDFISSLPEGYDTKVGERGFLLSGGQKQRIAIARAVVSDPRILLLDEATSALDTKSEGVVQAALDKAAQGRTTIVIAHRLSTIKNADNIVVMQSGKIIEQGGHNELLDKRGAYFSLVEAQRIAQQKEVVEGTEAVEDTELEKQMSSKLVSRTYSGDLEDLDPAKLTKTQTGKSLSSIAMQQKDQEKQQKYSLLTLIKLVWSFNRDEWYLAAIGFLFCIVAGGGQPTQSIFFAKAVQSISLPPAFYDRLRSDTNFWAAMYLMLAFVMLIAYTTQSWAFGYCQEAIIRRARLKAFRVLLRQDIAFFDQDSNTSGGLTSFLSTAITDLAGLSGSTLGTILSVSTTLVASIVVSIVIGWKLALVCIGAVPILIGCGYLRFSMLSRFQARSKSAYEGSAGFACEATSAIRTVASLTRETDVLQKYRTQLNEQARKSLHSVLKSSLLYAASQSLVFLCTALGFWYGGTLIAKREYNQFQFFVVFQSIIFGAQSAGTIFSFAPDMGKARNSAIELKKLFDRKPSIDSWSEEGERLETMEGTIEFRDVHFRYPTRPDQPVLRGLNLTVEPGQYVALVGASGCGKSTTIALLERFYDPLAGGVFVDGREISKLHLNTYRSFIALVSQEPTLYQGTVRENILLGADREDVPEEEIIKACKDANIYEFILSLPEGFNTVCGSKGTLLSGGQKQRVAIARALLRNPKVLLLDEATSALDSESEQIVQAALDAAAKGRTTIAVAHRLSTIQKADIIYVIDNGRVVEQGNHNDLLSKRGRYAELVMLQSLEKGL